MYYFIVFTIGGIFGLALASIMGSAKIADTQSQYEEVIRELLRADAERGA